MDRRDFFKTSFYLSALAMVQLTGIGCSRQPGSAESSSGLPPLPYKNDALEPYISSRTIEFHYGKHHQGYAANTLKMIAGTNLAKLPLKDIILKSQGIKELIPTYNNTAQLFNHNFYWESMKPKGGGKPQGKILQAIEQSFGGFDAFVKTFTESATAQFGSGWTWLVKDGNHLKVINTGNADTPLTMELIPLLTIDLWEHAYYLDYQNRRADYIRTFLDHLVNWDFAGKNLELAG
jgi:superoxide dismutase, Fe-Mn family